MKRVFDTFDQLKIEAESEEETEKEVPERPPPPAIPKRNFEVEPKENDSGVSSGGENPTDVLQEIFPQEKLHFILSDVSSFCFGENLCTASSN